MEALMYGTFGVLAFVALGLQFLAMKTKSEITSGSNPQFKIFQHKFFVVYFMVLFSDWLQGPYVYKLYSYYGFSSSQIAFLYVVGFASSGIFGTLTGPLVDKLGRKRMAFVFCFLYSFCCFTKISSNFYWLFVGRIFGGISTSLLFSTFESWYVYEHTETYDFPSEWISVTFSKATFWNAVLAINAGVFANIFAENLHFGPVAPFMLAIPFLFIASIFISTTWNENYGNRSFKFRNSCLEGLQTILFKNTILYLGAIQSIFEANMYIFVFQWTPILDSSHPPLGMVFACFMICIMIGSSLFTIFLSKGCKEETLLLAAVVISTFSTSICIFSTAKGSENIYISLLAFLILEISVGIYFPAIGYLRAQIIPEDTRASIMNWFRLPMNMFTCAGLLLYNQHLISSTQSMFTICTLMLMSAIVLSKKFILLYRRQIISEEITFQL